MVQKGRSSGSSWLSETGTALKTSSFLSHKVVINAVKDKHENNFRIVLNTLLNKKEVPHSGKKKPFSNYNFITILNENKYEIGNDFDILLVKPNFNTSHKDVKKIALTIYKPPC